jgi:hypothetical protein
MKNWNELKMTPQFVDEEDFREVRTTEHITDSDYVPKPQDAHLWRQAYIPNIDVMTRQEFRQYLDQIQTHRHNLFENQSHEEGASPDVSLYQISNSNLRTARQDEYARHVSRERRSDPHNKEIEHMPHSSGGLTYAHYSPLQTFIMTKERKGRLADECRGKDKNSLFYVASFAGMGGFVHKKHAGAARPMVWEDPNRTGEVMIRPQKVLIHRIPRVVGWERQGLKGAKLVMHLRVWDGQSHDRSNPHPPGSRKYIAADAQTTFVSSLPGSANKTIHRAVANSGGRSSDATLNMLKYIMRKPEESS